MNKAIEAFALAIATDGLTPPNEILDDGLIHRFSSDSKRHRKNGWYSLHSGVIAAGAFGDWRLGITQTWCSKCDMTITERERWIHRKHVAEIGRHQEEKLKQRQQLAAASALKRWTVATKCTSHAYLIQKGIQPHGAKIERENLLIPMRDSAAGTLHSLQTITPDGIKKFMGGGRVKGCYFGIGKPNGVLIVFEGFATGGSFELRHCFNE
jgi:putative DNA primase/helicase